MSHQESALLVVGQMSASVLRRDLVGTPWHPLQSTLCAAKMNLLLSKFVFLGSCFSSIQYGLLSYGNIPEESKWGELQLSLLWFF